MALDSNLLVSYSIPDLTEWAFQLCRLEATWSKTLLARSTSRENSS